MACVNAKQLRKVIAIIRKEKGQEPTLKDLKEFLNLD